MGSRTLVVGKCLKEVCTDNIPLSPLSVTYRFEADGIRTNVISFVVSLRL